MSQDVLSCVSKSAPRLRLTCRRGPSPAPPDGRGASDEVHASNGDAAGLLALKLLTDARRTARTGGNGELIPLDELDRGIWDRQAIAEGVALAAAAWSKGSVGEYQLQAAIAAVHDEAARAEDTDWPQILSLYGMLQRVTANPLVALNHAIATAMAERPRGGLAVLAPLQDDERLRCIGRRRRRRRACRRETAS